VRIAIDPTDAERLRRRIADSADGSFLHDANCLGCHDTGIYTRKDRRIRSLDALKGQLANCSHMANQQFSAIEMQNIIKYLNDQFYQFR
jgi:hypothetical protein